MRKVVETIYCDLCQSPIEQFKIINVPCLTKDNQIGTIEKEVCYNCCNKIINFFNNFNNINSTQIVQLENNDNSNNKNLIIENVDIQIPTLNKLPNTPLSDKWPDTKIFLSGIGHAKERAIHRDFKIPYVLDSIIDFPSKPSKLVKEYFDYIKNNNIEYLLDSGAFTYLMKPNKAISLEAYIAKYCYYINEFDIKYFFEFDVDSMLSLDDIENIRRKIFFETHKKPIIVYHDERGHDYWINMCKENELIAVGGIASAKAYTPKDQERYAILCEEAHQYGTIVHGLGFTPLSLLNSRTMFFDMVDSTSWNYSKRGYAAKINEKGEMTRVELPFSYLTTESQENDLREWAKFITNYRGAPRK